MEEKLTRTCARCHCEIPLNSPSIFLMEGMVSERLSTELLDLCRPCFCALKGWIDGGGVEGG